MKIYTEQRSRTLYFCHLSRVLGYLRKPVRLVVDDMVQKVLRTSGWKGPTPEIGETFRLTKPLTGAKRRLAERLAWVLVERLEWEAKFRSTDIFDRCFRQWTVYLRRVERRSRTYIRNLRTAYRVHIKDAIGAMQMREVQTRHVRRILKNVRRKGLSNRTHNRVRWVVAGTFTHWIDDLDDEVAARTVNPGRRAKRRQEPVDLKLFSPEEGQDEVLVDALIAAAPEPDRHVYALLNQTALRPCELFPEGKPDRKAPQTSRPAEWPDWNRRDRTLRIVGKRGIERIVPLNRTATAALCRLAQPTGPIFRGAYPRVRKAFRDACRAAGVPDTFRLAQWHEAARFAPEMADAILEHLTKRFRPLFRFSRETGLPVFVLLNLDPQRGYAKRRTPGPEWSDWDRERQELRLALAGQEPQVLALTPAAQAILEELSTPKGRICPMSLSRLRARFRELAAEVGVPPDRRKLKIFRKQAATRVLNLPGVSTREAADYIGDKSESVLLQHYAQRKQQRLRELAERIDPAGRGKLIPLPKPSSDQGDSGVSESVSELGYGWKRRKRK